MNDISATPKITNVCLFTNGQIMVFDQFGKQMPEYQGPCEEVWPRLVAAGWDQPAELYDWELDGVVPIYTH